MDPLSIKPSIRLEPLISKYPDDYYEMISFLKELEQKAFNYLMYPQITYKNRKLISLEEQDQEFVETLFVDLHCVLNSRPILKYELLDWVRHYESLYRIYTRLHRRKPIKNFHSEAVKYIFLFVYAANSDIRDTFKAQAYFFKFRRPHV